MTDSTWLKSARAALRMTQRELADALNVAPSTVAAWEQGVHRLSGPAAVAVQLMLRLTGRENVHDRT